MSTLPSLFFLARPKRTLVAGTHTVLLELGVIVIGRAQAQGLRSQGRHKSGHDRGRLNNAVPSRG